MQARGAAECIKPAHSYHPRSSPPPLACPSLLAHLSHSTPISTNISLPTPCLHGHELLPHRAHHGPLPPHQRPLHESRHGEEHRGVHHHGGHAANLEGVGLRVSVGAMGERGNRCITSDSNSNHHQHHRSRICYAHAPPQLPPPACMPNMPTHHPGLSTYAHSRCL